MKDLYKHKITHFCYLHLRSHKPNSYLTISHFETKMPTCKKEKNKSAFQGET